ncbi:MAG: hypothetical protein HYZ37_12245 [Candidatus Solibacter usitatus]|nr:hypothetical protein [Candidatus Solibacter usitatus]
MPISLQSPVEYCAPAPGHAGAAIVCSAAIPDPIRREVLLRRAWETAVREDPKEAARFYAFVRGRSWVASAGFHASLELAFRLNAQDGEALLTAAISKDPGIALREMRSLLALPYGRTLLEKACVAAPGEAMAIASGVSPTGQVLLQLLESSRDSNLRLVARLAKDNSNELPTRQRAANLFEDGFDNAASAQSYFSRLVERGASDGLLSEFAMHYLRELRQSGARVNLRQWSARDLYLLMVHGRETMDGDLFRALTQSALREKLTGASLASWPHARAFLSDALLYSSADYLNASQFAEALRGIHQAVNPLDELLYAAEIIDRLPARSLAAAAAVIQEESTRGDSAGLLYGMLAARLAARLPRDTAIARTGAAYAGFFQTPQAASMDSLFGREGRSIHRYYFYNDDDGVESFAAFRGGYQRSADWKWEDHGAWVRATSTHPGRRIEIYANVPADLALPSNRGRDAELDARNVETDRALGSSEPDVVVHRGHAFHLPKTLARLKPSAKLVFLGSCRGMENVERVLAAAPRAQIIATRGTGTHTVNDPLLKALNQALLRAAGDLDWTRFWASVTERFPGNAMFAEYTPPHRNTQAILLKAYFEYLSRGVDLD